MVILPAIDLQKGKVVRLRRGDFSGATVYSDQPMAVAKEWELQGAEWIHLVDLDGAMTGNYENLTLIGKIAHSVQCSIEMGGGIRTREGIQEALAQGASRVVLGTRAATDEKFLSKILKEFSKRIAVAVDIQEGKIMTRGWTKELDVQALDFVQRLEEMGVPLIVLTDVQRDGMLAGPNLQLIEEILQKVQMKVIASGGVSSLEDIRQLKNFSSRYPHLVGVIVGKALYEGKVKLQEAIRITD